MPNRQMHLEIGFAVGLGVIVVLILMDEDRRRSAIEYIGAGLGSLVGSVAPDVAEPARTPNHRAVFHSVVALAGMGIVAVDPNDNFLEFRERIRFVAGGVRQQRESLPEGHSQRPSLWRKEYAYYLAVGASIGFPLGYGSHLVADSETSDLPILGL